MRMTQDQRELISRLLTLLDRDMESDSMRNVLCVPFKSKDWERRMLEAAQQLAEEYPEIDDSTEEFPK